MRDLGDQLAAREIIGRLRDQFGPLLDLFASDGPLSAHQIARRMRISRANAARMLGQMRETAMEAMA